MSHELDLNSGSGSKIYAFNSYTHASQLLMCLQIVERFFF